MALAALFAACGRDDGNASHSGNQQIVNELTIDGITYPMTVTALDDMLFRAIDANGQRFVLTGGIQHSDLGDDIDLTWDLTQPVEGIHFTFSLEGSLSLYLVYDNNGVKISGMLDHQEYDGESMFYSGTATLKYNAEGLFVTVSGLLMNGRSFAYKLSMPTLMEPEERLNPNEIAVGSIRYGVQPSLSVTNEMVYLFDVLSTDDEVDMALDLPESLLGVKTRLYNLTGEGGYLMRFNSPIVSFVQQCLPNNTYAEIDGSPLLSSVFYEGAMLFSHEETEDLYSVVVNGRLSNSIPFAARLQVPVEEIRAMDYQIVIDGQPYQLDYTLTLQEGRYTLLAAAYPHDAILDASTLVLFTLRLSFPSSALNQTVDLAEGSPAVDYSLELMGAGLPIDLPTPIRFTRGTLRLDHDDQSVGASLVGTLANGHAISMKARVGDSQIIRRGDR